MSLTIYQRRRQNKRKLLEYLVAEIPKHRGFLVVGITGVEARTLQAARKALKGKAKIKVIKNTILAKALEKVDLAEEVKQKVKAALSHENAIVFTDDSVFSVAAELSKFTQNTYIKPNRVTPVDIVIPAGVTPLQPGPLTDSLNALGIPFEVKKNLVYIKRDTLVVRKGERVNARIAELLRELEIAPITSGFELKLAVEDGLLIPGESLRVDLSKYVKELSEAQKAALTLSVNLGIPVAEAMPLILARAAAQALALAVEAGYPTPEAIPYILAKATAAANALSTLVKAQRGEQ